MWYLRAHLLLQLVRRNMNAFPLLCHRDFCLNSQFLAIFMCLCHMLNMCAYNVNSNDDTIYNLPWFVCNSCACQILQTKWLKKKRSILPLWEEDAECSLLMIIICLAKVVIAIIFGHTIRHHNTKSTKLLWLGVFLMVQSHTRNDISHGYKC